MAELKNDGKVMVISPKQWEILQDVVGGGAPRGKAMRDLEQAGIIDEYGLTAPSSAILSGFLLSRARLQTNVLDPRGIRRVDLWISPRVVTVVKLFNPKECHIYTLETPEVPNAMLQFLDFRPRPQYSEGAFAISAEALEAAYEGDYDQLRRLLIDTASAIPDSDLAQTIFDDSWFLTLMMRDKVSEGDWETQDVGIFFSVPNCLYFAGLEPDSDGLHQLVMINSTEVWHGISDWFFV